MSQRLDRREVAGEHHPLLLVSHQGNGFIVPESEVVANTRKGKQVMNVKAPDEAQTCIPVAGDHAAIVGENRKMLVFPLAWSQTWTVRRS